MEQFLLNFTNTFSQRAYGVYRTCSEVRCGVFEFDDFCALPAAIVLRLGLIEIEDYDDERKRRLYAYTTNFNA